MRTAARCAWMAMMAAGLHAGPLGTGIPSARAEDTAFYRVVAESASRIESLNTNLDMVWSTQDADSNCTVLGATNLVSGSWMPVAYTRATGCLGRATAPAINRKDLWTDPHEMVRAAPVCLGNHPGNIFLVGETVAFPVPGGIPGSVTNWTACDEMGQVVASGICSGGVINAGPLDTGWYRFDFMAATGSVGWTSAAVLAPLVAATPQDSPFCMDAALAGFANGDSNRTEAFSSLTALAGVNWMRDRGSWSETEPTQNVFAAQGNKFDLSAAIQASNGLKVLQVQHDIPHWATNSLLDGGARNCFPRDLRDAYDYFKHVSGRFAGRVLAWEPWNEANIEAFGGHLADERCTFQKAAWLGLKAGNTNMTVCWNVLSGAGDELDIEGVLRNEAWPYFDTYDIHAYEHPEQFVAQFEPGRLAACGKPIWLTECGIHVSADTRTPGFELNSENQIRQASFFARAFASALHAGVNRFFVFLLANYYEAWCGTQFGILREDLTPRPAYVACAAIGRLLAGARPIGRYVPPEDTAVRLYAFRAYPDGLERDVLVCWATNATAWTLPSNIVVTTPFDYLGRSLPAWPTQLDERVVYAVSPVGEASKLKLDPPCTQSFRRDGPASPVVLQLELPRALNRLEDCAHLLTAASNITVHVYNFSTGAVSGAVRLEYAPPEWIGEPREWPLTLGALDRETIHLPVTMPDTGREAAFGGWIKLRGDFGATGEPVLASRFINDIRNVTPATVIPICSSTNPTVWQTNIANGATLAVSAAPSETAFDVQFAAQGDAWAYPYLELPPSERPAADSDGLLFTLNTTEGDGSYHALFLEENGSVYTSGIWRGDANPAGQNSVALFSWASAAGWAPPDDNFHLDPEKVVRLYIGLNGIPAQRATWSVADVRWARY